jgi:glyoxylase-like metal-dependent hydrolase (beta-lactamase superfamily II)
MKELAANLWLLGGFPRYAINVYLIGDVLIDAGTRYASRRILLQLRRRPLAAHALTHAHPDHQGASRAVCVSRGVPFWCSAGDAPAAETEGEVVARLPNNRLTRLIGPLWTGPPHPVARRLEEGDLVGDFRVIATPGHTVGHISYWRERDRVLIVGDVLANLHFLTARAGLREPPPFFSVDPRENRRSALKLAALEPSLICFGHGPPSRDTRGFVEFINRLNA